MDTNHVDKNGSKVFLSFAKDGSTWQQKNQNYELDEGSEASASQDSVTILVGGVTDSQHAQRKKLS